MCKKSCTRECNLFQFPDINARNPSSSGKDIFLIQFSLFFVPKSVAPINSNLFYVAKRHCVGMSIRILHQIQRLVIGVIYREFEHSFRAVLTVYAHIGERERMIPYPLPDLSKGRAVGR